jgi:molecular chaperone HscB
MNLSLRRAHIGIAVVQYWQASFVARRLYSSNSHTTHNFYHFFPTLFPHGGPPKDPFAIDARALKGEFLRLQSETHPDKVQSSNDEDLRRRYELRSSHLNIAYKSLLDPLLRAQHVLLLNGIDALAEKDTLTDEDLLMEVLIARENISEVSSEEELRQLEKDNNEKLVQTEATLERAFKDSDFELAKVETIKLSYWQNIKRQIDEMKSVLLGD